MIITLQLTGNYELENLLLGFADEVEVLQPEGLRNKIAERMSQATKKYHSVISTTKEEKSLLSR